MYEFFVKAANELYPIFVVFGTAFVFIGIIWFIVSLYRMSKGKTQEEGVEVSDIFPHASGDDAVVAAISAAITAYLTEEAAKEGREYKGFKIVSFKRSNKGKAWTDR